MRADTLARLSYKVEVHDILHGLTSFSATRSVPPYACAVVHAGRGEMAEALK